MESSSDQERGAADVTASERLAYYLKVLRRRWLVVALVPSVAVLISLGLSLQAQKKYDATAKVVVNPTNQITALLNPAALSSSDPERDLNTEVARITTAPVAQSVKRRLRLRADREDLLDQVTTSLEGTTNIVKVTVRDPNAARAAALANAFATRYVEMREDDARKAFREAAARARSQLASLTLAQRHRAQGRELRSRLRDLEVGGTLQTGNAEVIQPAATPTSPASPRLLFNAGLAALLGLILGLVAAGGLEVLDRRLRDEEDVEAITGLPSLGIIPCARRGGRGRRLAREQTEAYRSLATNLRFFKLGGEVKTLMITSASPLDGKTSVTLSLAAALAEFGQRVVAVEADLRRPCFADYLEIPQAAGLSSVLAGMASWEQEVVEVDVGAWRPDEWASGREPVRFSVLPGGHPPPNPHALLSSTGMHDLMLQLRSAADVVLIDTPPLGTFTDAVPLLPGVDGVALAVGLQRTTRDALKRACDALADLAAPVLGTVLIGGAGPALSSYYESTRSPRASAGVRNDAQDVAGNGRVSGGAPASRA